MISKMKESDTYLFLFLKTFNFIDVNDLFIYFLYVHLLKFPSKSLKVAKLENFQQLLSKNFLLMFYFECKFSQK